jgi:hypothetical protein
MTRTTVGAYEHDYIFFTKFRLGSALVRPRAEPFNQDFSERRGA